MLLADVRPPHVLIADVMMPGMNGIDLAAWFAKHHRDCNVLLVSGHPEAAALLEESKLRGMRHTILPKPVHPTEIVAFITAGRPSPRTRQDLIAN